MFKCIPLPFKGCNRQVEYVDKSHSSLSEIPDDIFRYSRSLEELFLDANHLRDLPKNLFRLTRLRRLTLSENEIVRIPSEISSLVNLVELDLSKNEIGDIPENIRFLRSLQVANFSQNPISSLPAGITHLRNLTTLVLNETSLQQLPQEFGFLASLESLELRDNLLRSLPVSFSMLVKLQRLDLGVNELEEIPEFIGCLPALEELWLDNNVITSLPHSIGSLRNLCCLDVSDNKLQYLPGSISGLESLTDFHLSRNELQLLPDGIGSLKRLNILKVDTNKLQSLNVSIGGCSSLQELILTQNRLTELPATIGKLIQLTNLNVDSNELEELPPTIGNLTKLSVLSCRGNRLCFLPQEIGNLSNLLVLDVSGNQLHHLPISVMALNLKALWLAENQSQPMPKFQKDTDEATGEKVLTCFLLPQMLNEEPSLSQDNLLDGNVLDRANSICWDKPRSTAVKFTEDESDEAKKSKADANFVRHDTPHPKDLKARYQKMVQERQKSDEKQEQSSETHQSYPSNDKSYDRTNTLSSNQSDCSAADSVVVRDIETGTSNRQLPSDRPVKTSFTDEPEEDDVEPVSEQTSIFIDRRVGFAREVTDGELRMEEMDEGERVERHEKLHRRDTPHHLKNKRINSSKADEEKVAAILAKSSVTQDIPGKNRQSGGQMRSPSPSSNRTGNEDTASASISNYSVPRSVPSLPTGPVEIKLMKVEVIKTGSGLGLSIAGGKESSPYKDDDLGIFISRITEGGAAQAAGLQVGDKLLCVNDVSLKDVDHYKAVHILKTCGPRFVAQIEREVPINVQRPHVSTSSMSDIAVQASLLDSSANRAAYNNSNNSNNNPNIGFQNVISSSHLHQSPAETAAVNKNRSNGDILPPNRHIEITVKTPPASPAETARSQVNRPPQPTVRTSTATLTSAKSVDRLLDNSSESNPVQMVPSLKNEKRVIIFHTTLIRDSAGLGFSIRGGKDGKTLGTDGTESVYISRVAEGGAAEKDGKIRVGDKILKIGSHDVEGATHKQVVSWLMTQDRFVRLVLEREVDASYEGDDVSLYQPPTRASSSNLSGIFPSSYIANRPSYTGSYRRPTLGSMGSMSSLSERGGGPVESGRTTPTTPNPGGRPMYSIYTKLPGLSNDNLQPASSSTMPGKGSRHYSSSSIEPFTTVTSAPLSASTLPTRGSSAVRNMQQQPISSSSRSASSHVNGYDPREANPTSQHYDPHSGNYSSDQSSSGFGDHSGRKASSAVATAILPNNALSVTVRIQETAEPDASAGNNSIATTTAPTDLSDEFPPPPTGLGTFTESITKTTFTETKTTRVTNNALKSTSSLSSLNQQQNLI